MTTTTFRAHKVRRAGAIRTRDPLKIKALLWKPGRLHLAVALTSSWEGEELSFLKAPQWLNTELYSPPLVVFPPEDQQGALLIPTS